MGILYVSPYCLYDWKFIGVFVFFAEKGGETPVFILHESCTNCRKCCNYSYSLADGNKCSSPTFNYNLPSFFVIWSRVADTSLISAKTSLYYYRLVRAVWVSSNWSPTIPFFGFCGFFLFSSSIILLIRKYSILRFLSW